MAAGRLKLEFVERTESFSDRCVAVAEQLEKDGRFRRIVEQLAASGSSVGANIAEADQAMSRSDFVKCMCIASKELAETRFWLRLCIRRGWVKEKSLEPLLNEVSELRNILSSIIARTRKRTTQRTT